MRILERLAISGMILLASVIGIFEIASKAGLRMNVEPSMPLGMYWLIPGPVARGDIVQACLPKQLSEYALRRQYLFKTGSACPDGVIPVVKVLAATSADHILVHESGIVINGKSWPMSALRRYDSSGHRVDLRLASGQLHCPSDTVFLLGEHPHSWDSRYWGCIPRSMVAGHLMPIPYTRWIISRFLTLSKEIS